MRPNVRRFVSAVMDNWIWRGGYTLENKLKVAEFGSRQVDTTVDTDIRPLVYAGACPLGQDYIAYTGFDYEAGPGVDKTWDLHQPPTADMKYDLVFCLETLEHVRRPYVAVDNLAKMLAPGGLLVLSVPYFFQWHARPHYWGITPDGLSALLEDAGLEHVVGMDPPSVEENGFSWEFPHTVVGLAWKAGEAKPFNYEGLGSVKWHGEFNGDPVKMVMTFRAEADKKEFKEWFTKQSVYDASKQAL